MNSGFLDLKVHPGGNFRKIRENKIGPNLTSKSKFMIFDPIFDPEDGKIMQI